MLASLFSLYASVIELADVDVPRKRFIVEALLPRGAFLGGELRFKKGS
jgi:hypothetical protein